VSLVLDGCFREKQNTYEFDRNLSVVQEIGTLEDDTKRSFANLLPYSVMYSHDVTRGGGHAGRSLRLRKSRRLIEDERRDGVLGGECAKTLVMRRREIDGYEYGQTVCNVLSNSMGWVG